ncbi:MAG: 5-(carboxyamino)imidazole ribonucleotide mutase [Candidatus Kapabacteria bacterium]|nr:5-(carboxyamino)imidazole ribonucleotide mutase [Ignavibacteriota bacterium]MCW5885110.1 5-(carboxyamino)imidazole ribonucleotide mutase [Candidatus Kapabacteria bacterium]
MAKVGIIMGSDSDLPTMQPAADVCKEFGIDCEIRVVSAHRTPDDMAEYAKTAKSRGISVIIAGAGGAAHLPGMTASYTTLPVIGVPVQSRALNGLDSLLSIVQMPAGVPVATVAIGGGKNAGLLALSILALNNESLSSKLEDYKIQIMNESREKNNNPVFS